jgi:tetratricopeptide (TPR) repeat protein
MTSNCRACGGKLPLLAVSCPECGAALTEPAAAVASAVTRPPEDVRAASAAETDQGVVVEAAGKLATGSRESGPLSVGQSFGKRYHIKRALGLGGMGAVYQAWDTELSVDVAIKLIRRELVATPTAAAAIERRFKRELLLARLVTHPNVVRIHDLGEIDGSKYITMSYVDGTDLATLLARDGPLGVRRALKIARQVCDGLVAAHAAGVVHRDLKPANVMVGGNDEALITDFGIARMTSGDTSDADTDEAKAAAPALALGARYGALTRVGATVGTIEYMPPEQALGRVVDQRADVYALGLVIYDMLVGTARFAAFENINAELKERCRAAPSTLRHRAPAVPAALDALVVRCAQPDPANRFQTSTELAKALARLDDNGVPLPVQRTVGLPRVLAAAAVALVAIGGAWWYLRPPPPPVEHDPITAVIADFANSTGDATFEQTLEPILKLSLETASFVTAFARSDVPRVLGVRAPESLDAQAATELAVKQGLGVVLAGAIELDGRRYRLTLTSTQPITGNVLARVAVVAADRDDVLSAVNELGGRMREALGDDESDADQRFALDTLSATSLEVVRDYAAAMDELANSRFAQARESFKKAIEQDPRFGLAHAGLAIASSNLGNQQDAERYVTEAMRHVDAMTERERFRTRGLYYLVTADYPSCVKEYGALVARFKADAAARNNAALCSTRLRDINTALAQMREAMAILPNRALYRVNTALYAAYAGDFTAAEAAATEARALSPFGLVPLAFAQFGLGRLDDARKTLQEFAQLDAVGASHAASGLADIASYAGRFDETVILLRAGADADLAADQPDRAASKLAAIAHAEASRGNQSAAIAAADAALEQSPTAKIRFLAARIFAEAGVADRAVALATELGASLQAESRAHAKVIDGEVALAAGDYVAAIKSLNEGNALLDTWIGHYTLGRAYLEAGAFAQADSEFDRCVTRRGEALALFLDEEPTFAFYPRVEYYRGRVYEALGSARFAESYQRFLDIRGAANEDPLLADVRRRVAASSPVASAQ